MLSNSSKSDAKYSQSALHLQQATIPPRQALLMILGLISNRGGDDGCAQDGLQNEYAGKRKWRKNPFANRHKSHKTYTFPFTDRWT